MSKNYISNKIQMLAPDFKDKVRGAEVISASSVVNFLDVMENLSSNECNIHLFVNYFIPENIDRRIEFDKCLAKNIDNKYIDRLFILTHEEVTDELKKQSHEKVKFISVKKGILSYKEIFNIMNKWCDENTISIFANLDIYFDETISHLKLMNWTNKAIALTRYDIQPDFTIKFRARYDSQDSWMFKGKIYPELIKRVFYTPGVPGCDNKLAYDMEQSGYTVFNPSLTIKSMHYHLTEFRTYNDDDRLKPPYKLVEYTILAESYIAQQINVKHDKHVLHIGINFEGQTKLVDMLGRLGSAYKRIEWNRLKLSGNDLKNYLLTEIISYVPNFIFMQIQTEKVIDAKFIKMIYKLFPDVKIINWTGDVREHVPAWMEDIAQEMKDNDNYYTCFSNEDDVKYLISNGCNSEYIQIGYEDHIFQKNGSTRKTIPEIIFMGNNYSHNRFELSQFRANVIIELANRYKNRFALYGNNWGGINPISFMNKPHKEAEAYRSCKIAIGINHFQRSRYHSDRAFRAMGSGAFYLTHNVPNIETDFKIGVHLDVWNNVKELIDKIEYYLNNENERKEIALRGNKLVEENHKWINRIDTIKKIIGW